MNTHIIIPLPVAEPFDLKQSLTFIQRFPPCQGDYLITDDSLTAAVAIDGKAVPFTIRGTTAIHVEVATADAGLAEVLVRRASDLVGARDDVTGFYTAAHGDPHFQGLVERMYGLHHVRFLTLEEIAVYCVMMQRRPIALASRMKQRFLECFGLRVSVAGKTLRAMPQFDQLVTLSGAEIAAAIQHARKGEQIAEVVRGVAAIGEEVLREAPYEEARDALLTIRGIGPFSAAAILLRGLGRMDELPTIMPGLDDTARELYGAAYSRRAIERRYGRHIGYWSFYLKTGVARLREVRALPTRRSPAVRISAR